MGKVASMLVLFGLVAGGVTASVQVSNRMPRVGQEIAVAVVVEADNLGSYTGELRWDAAVLSYAGYWGLPEGFTCVVNVRDVGAGRLRFSGANAYGASGEVALITVVFRAVGAGRSVLDLGFETMAEAGSFADLLPGLKVRDQWVLVRR